MPGLHSLALSHVFDSRRRIHFRLPLGIQTLHLLLAILLCQLYLSPSVQRHCPLFNPFHRVLPMLDLAPDPHPILGRLAAVHIGAAVDGFAPKAADFAFGLYHFFALEMSF